MEIFENFATIPAFVVIVYLLAECFKKIKDGALNQYIPIICGVLGALLGVVCFALCPGYIPADNWFDAIAIGIVSGFAATGVNQVYKQLTSNLDE